jgi:perosamine synthetase
MIRIPLSSPDIDESDIAAVCEVLRTSQLSLGPKLAAFEESIANYVGVSNVAAVNSGTSALHLSLEALGITEGDEVIVPSFTFIAVANTVRYARAVPVFVDIDPDTLNINPQLIEPAITGRTKAIIVVHTFGVPADINEIREVARAHGIAIIEDACEALGAEYFGRKVGGLGDAAAFGFYPNKQMTTGEGGAVVTANPRLIEKVKTLRNQGAGRPESWLAYTEIGFNYRISDINCALGISQLARLDAILACRETLARGYDARLASVPALRRPALALPNRKISWFVYVVRLEEQFTRNDRDQIIQEMRSIGIAVGRYFAPIHLQPAYRTSRSSKLSFPETEKAAGHSLALPFHNRLRDVEVDEVCEKLSSLVCRFGLSSC